MISIVTSLYKSSAYINMFYEEIVLCVTSLGLDYEFIFVNDYSPDSSADVVKSIINKDSNVRLIELSRNFGQLNAIRCGISYAEGDYIFVLDCDLEEDPKLFEAFYKKLQSENLDVVFGVVEKRNGNPLVKFLSNQYYKIFTKLSSINMTKDQAWMRLMSRRYANALLRHKESSIYMAGVMHITGFKQEPFLIEKIYKGSTSYSIKKKISMAIDALVSFSSKPLYVISIFGIFISFLSFLLASFWTFKKLSGKEVSSGWSSTIVSIWLSCGFIILSLGIISIYVGKIFQEVKQRPNFLVREFINFKEPDKNNRNNSVI